ncbi:MAG: hypothetical protein ACKODY_03380 [Actinomycetota bacterium]
MATSERISREDIEAKLKGLQGDVQTKVDDRRSTVVTVGVVAGVVVVALFYVLGRRSGRRRSAVVEIRRV